MMKSKMPAFNMLICLSQKQSRSMKDTFNVEYCEQNAEDYEFHPFAKHICAMNTIIKYYELHVLYIFSNDFKNSTISNLT